MQLHSIDVAIILIYLLATIAIGVLIAKKASRSLDSYFLGDRGLPWYILGAASAGARLDLATVLLLVNFCFLYGIKSAWLMWVWPMFSQVFFMIFLAVWLRRSHVLTGAEWITVRFGRNYGAKLAHLSLVLFATCCAIVFFALSFQGVGLFADLVLPWDLNIIPGLASADLYAILFVGITAIYTISGGFPGVVFNQVLQYLLLAVASISVGVIAITKVSPAMLDNVIPAGWKSMSFGWALDLDWTGLLNGANIKMAQEGYALFGVIFMLMLFRGLLLSLAGPAPDGFMQRILAARSAREAGLMSGLVNILAFLPLYLLIAGLTVLALVFYLPQLRVMGTAPDLTAVLPLVFRNFIPVGLMGLVLTGLFAVFMSAFASMLNAAPAYIVNDIYKRYINRDDTQESYVHLGKITATVLVVCGIIVGLMLKPLSATTVWILAALWSGYAVVNVLKWYWWRFNGYGYFWGMAAGLPAGLIAPFFLPQAWLIFSFPLIMLISALCAVFATLITPANADIVLKYFYEHTRPWGLWAPVHKMVQKERPDLRKNTACGRDWANVGFGLLWQMALVALPIFMVLQQWLVVAALAAVFAITTFVLKINWYDKLEE